jgi:N-acetylneuraminic acid mutarotase
MRTARASQTATLLTNGLVLVAGGTGENGGALASSELYNSASGTWSSTGSLNVARVSARSVLLANGVVLTMGGCVSNDCLSSTTRSAEIYNPMSGTWTVTGSMRTARAEFIAVLLPSKKVLVAGGCTSYNVNGCVAVTTAAELYDPTTGTWTSTGAMRAGRMAMTGTVLPNAKALIAGGQTAASDALGSSELYNPVTGTFSLTGRLITPRSGHTATLLKNGFVLMAGGENVNGVSISKAELYNAATGMYAATGNMPSVRQEHVAVLLPTGSVLVVGGNNVNSTTTTALASCATYNPATRTWATASTMKNARVDHTATLLTNGHVLAAGGDNASGELSSAELF